MTAPAQSAIAWPLRRVVAAALAAFALLAAWAVPPALFGFLVVAAAFAWLLPQPSRWLALLTWLLPFHIVAMAILFGGLGLPSPVVRTIAAWKDAAILACLVAVVVRAATGRGARASVCWLDLAVGALIALAVVQFLAGPMVGRPDGGTIALLYGLRDAAFFLVPYFIGRATPGIVEDDGALRRLYLVGVLTSAIAIVEWLFVPPQLLVLLGVALYYNDFLGIGAMMGGNEFGLPANYWTTFGDMELRRAGSVQLSSQGFAVPFLLIVPAATIWLLTTRRASRWNGLGYAVLWLGLLLSVTRMTIVTCVLQLLLLTVLFDRRGLALGIIGSLLTALGVAIAAVPRLGTFVWQTLTWGHASSASHVKDYLKGLNALAEWPLGAGLGTSDQSAIRFGIDPLTFDNQYLKIAVELGIPGLLLLVAIVVGIVAVSVRLMRTGDTQPRRALGAVLLVATLGIAVNGMTNAVYGNFMLSYIYFWLAGAAVTLSLRLPSSARAGGG